MHVIYDKRYFYFKYSCLRKTGKPVKNLHFLDFMQFSIPSPSIYESNVEVVSLASIALYIV